METDGGNFGSPDSRNCEHRSGQKTKEPSRVKFPNGLRQDDILQVLIKEPRVSRIFIVSTYHSSPRNDAIYGYFDDEYGDAPPKLLHSVDVLSVERIGKSVELMRIIKERNRLRQRIGRIENKLKDLLR